MTSPSDEVWIAAVDASVENSAILARFTLGGRPVDPQWQGAFGRALDGKLEPVAGRWRIDSHGIAVTRVEPGHAAQVAALVRDAVDAANEYVAGVVDAALADRDAVTRHEAGLRLEVAEAQTAMREQLGVPKGATDGPAAARLHIVRATQG